MKYIIANPVNGSKNYFFRISDELAECVLEHDYLHCETVNGPMAFYAASAPLSGDKATEAAIRCGATLPIRRVLGVKKELPYKDLTLAPRLRGSMPKQRKLLKRLRELGQYGAFQTTITVEDGILTDGLSAYLIAEALQLGTIPYIILDDNREDM